MKPSDTVSLVVDGKRHEGWTRVRVTAGIERLARDFSIDITYRWPGQPTRQTFCNPFDACVLMIGENKVLTGYIDAVSVRYDNTNIAISLSGRSKTADLIDCSAEDEPGQWIGQKLEAIAQALAKPYGVHVRADTDTGEALADHQVMIGETVFEGIDRMLKERQVLACDDADGSLVFVKPGALRATTSLALGENILSADYPCNWQDRFSVYRCKGQSSGTDEAYGEAVSEGNGTAKDSKVKRHRLLLIQQSGQADSMSCGDRAAYERDLRAAKAEVVRYTVQGWRQADGSLWVPNSVVHISDAFLGIERDMLISEVSYSIDGSGTLAQLTVVPPEAFKRIGGRE